MEKVQFLALLDELLEFDEGTLKGHELLSELDWDSLASIGFIAMIDEKFGKIVSPSALLKAEKVGDLIAMVV